MEQFTLIVLLPAMLVSVAACDPRAMSEPPPAVTAQALVMVIVTWKVLETVLAFAAGATAKPIRGIIAPSKK